VNTPEEVDRLAGLTRGLFGDRAFYPAPQPLPGAEDFSYVLEEVPGTYLGLGATPAGVDPATAAYNHAPGARFADEALAVGPAVLAALALDRLAQG
jgi:hippurate hydrolase